MLLSPQANESFWHQHQGHIAVNPHRARGAEGLAEFAAEQEATRRLLFFQTSGSEGAPKWVGLSREAFLASARAVNAHLQASSRDRWLIALPLHHVGGFSILARCHEAGSAFFQMEEKWSALAFARQCAREGIALTSLVPTQVFDLVQAGLRAPSCLRAVVVGGGSLGRELGQRARALGWPVLQSYGMTEAASQIATEPLEHLRSGFDPESLEVLPCWDVESTKDGSLIIRGPALASGYATKCQGQWSWDPVDASVGLVTRDRVELWQHDARRFLRFAGRDSSFVKVLGELVNVAALRTRLEEVACAHGCPPSAVVVLALPDARRETKLVLAGEVPAAELELLRNAFNQQSPGCERLEAAHAMNSLPRTVLGKVNEAALRARLTGAAPSAEGTQ